MHSSFAFQSLLTCPLENFWQAPSQGPQAVSQREVVVVGGRVEVGGDTVVVVDGSFVVVVNSSGSEK